jgi:hypothetical protein
MKRRRPLPKILKQPILETSRWEEPDANVRRKQVHEQVVERVEAVCQYLEIGKGFRVDRMDMRFTPDKLDGLTPFQNALFSALLSHAFPEAFRSPHGNRRKHERSRELRAFINKHKAEHGVLGAAKLFVKAHGRVDGSVSSVRARYYALEREAAHEKLCQQVAELIPQAVKTHSSTGTTACDSSSFAVVAGGKGYIVLRNDFEKIVAVYRVRNDAGLTWLRRWPAVFGKPTGATPRI